MSAATDNLDPAFPTRTTGMVATDGSWLRDVAPGMTLRDWFAGQALAGWGEGHHRLTDNQGPYSGQMARAAYLIADAMLAERANNNKGRD